MDTDKDEPLYKSESRKIVGAAMEVFNEIGHGFHEKPYENGVQMNTSVSISVHQWFKQTSRQVGAANSAQPRFNP